MKHSNKTLELGHHLKFNLSCSECMDKCDEDAKCDGVECGSRSCGLLNNQACNNTNLVSNSDSDIDTCFKTIPFQCENISKNISCSLQNQHHIQNLYSKYSY